MCIEGLSKVLTSVVSKKVVPRFWRLVVCRTKVPRNFVEPRFPGIPGSPSHTVQTCLSLFLVFYGFVMSDFMDSAVLQPLMFLWHQLKKQDKILFPPDNALQYQADIDRLTWQESNSLFESSIQQAFDLTCAILLVCFCTIVLLAKAILVLLKKRVNICRV